MDKHKNWVEADEHRAGDPNGAVDFDLLNETVSDALCRYGRASNDRYLASILDAAVWRWTERFGKYRTGFVTSAARLQRTANQQTKGRWLHQDLQHEHVVTKSFLKAQMREVGDATPLLNAVACIVTREEHRRLNASVAHGWQRYVDAGIVDLLNDADVAIDLYALIAGEH